jgi:RNA recognition motif-containing protein
MIYDRAGRVEGTCFVTYKHESDAMAAIRANDGAKAMDQPITITFVRPQPPRSLFERITFPQTANKRHDASLTPAAPGKHRTVEPEKHERNRRQRKNRHRRDSRDKNTQNGSFGGATAQEVVGEMEVNMNGAAKDEAALAPVGVHDTIMAEDEYDLIL